MAESVILLTSDDNISTMLQRGECHDHPLAAVSRYCISHNLNIDALLHFTVEFKASSKS